MSELVKSSKIKVFLLVVDETEEFPIAVDYAADFASDENARIALLNVMQIDLIF